MSGPLPPAAQVRNYLRMKLMPLGWFRRISTSIAAFLLALACIAPLAAQPPEKAAEPVQWEDEEAAWILAHQYLEGGPESRTALIEALRRMGWSVRTQQGAVLSAPAPGADTGLAMRDYELEELLWSSSAQPALRLISFAQAIAVPFPDADAEELAQDIVTTLRLSALSAQPQQRFWARFILALGRASPANYDLLAPGEYGVLPPAKLTEAEARALASNPMAMLAAVQSTPVWSPDDPVLAPSPRPKGDNERETTPERDQKRMRELNQEMMTLAAALGSPDEKIRQAAEARMAKVSQEMSWISGRQTSAVMRNMSQSASRTLATMKGETDDDEDEEDDDEEDDEDADSSARFLAEWRDQPLSLLQVMLISRVLSADLLISPSSAKGVRTTASRPRASTHFPFAMLTLAQAAPAPSGPTFSGQFAGAIGDIWATSWGAYTGNLISKHLPNSSYGQRVAIANAIMVWTKTIITVARQDITIEVENIPLVRTKTRSPGEQRRVRANVKIDFPKAEILKAIRAAGNIATIDLAVPDGGPISGAKVVWRLPEGSHNGKYQTAKGGSQYRPELAVVQFAQAGGKAAYVSSTNAAGDAFITIEGVPQRRNLPPNVRPYPRRAAVGVEVTLKVGNLTQDLNDAINTALGGPVFGGLGFLADMVSRTSFFFHQTEVFPVRDWKEPTWEGEFEITIKASGSDQDKGSKGGPPTTYTWQMDRYMEGRLLTPESEEEREADNDYKTDGRHQLEVDGDSRYFRLNDQSSARSSRVNNRYTAKGPLQVQPPGQNRLATYSRAEPSGNATLTFTGNKAILELRPFFGAECLVTRSEQSGGRSSRQAGPRYLSLLEGVYPDSFTLIADYDGRQDVIEGSRTYEALGSLPFVPNFEAEITVKYRLWKNNPPPPNAAR